MTDIGFPDERVEVQACDLSLKERANALVDDLSQVVGWGFRREATTYIETIRFLGGAYREVRSRNGEPFEVEAGGVRFLRLGADVLFAP